MNFLAHSLFDLKDAEVLVGQFCGDFVRGSNLSEYSPGIQQGIRLHRAIDAYTDHYPELMAVRHRFAAPYRRYSGIIVDVLFDHFIARDWDRFRSTTLSEHAGSVYDALDDHHHVLPGDLQRFSRFIRQESVLESNVSLNGVATTLERLSRRSPRFSPLADGLSAAEPHLHDLARCFHAFFPDLETHVMQLTNSDNSDRSPDG